MLAISVRQSTLLRSCCVGIYGPLGHTQTSSQVDISRASSESLMGLEKATMGSNIAPRVLSDISGVMFAKAGP